MLIENLLFVIRCMPKITIFYLIFSFLMGLELNQIVLGTTVAFDVLDWIPI